MNTVNDRLQTVIEQTVLAQSILIESILSIDKYLHYSSSSSSSFLVLYGGASPEEGPMGDTVYAELPCPSLIGEVT